MPATWSCPCRFQTTRTDYITQRIFQSKKKGEGLGWVGKSSIAIQVGYVPNLKHRSHFFPLHLAMDAKEYSVHLDKNHMTQHWHVISWDENVLIIEQRILTLIDLHQHSKQWPSTQRLVEYSQKDRGHGTYYYKLDCTDITPTDSLRDCGNKVTCGLRLRDRKSGEEMGHRSETKRFCGKTIKLPVTLIQGQFCVSPLWCWRLWYVEW